MPTPRDTPAELKAFNKIFEIISRRCDYSIVFYDFLTIMVNYFSLQPKPLDWGGRYDRSDLDLFNDLLREYLLAFQRSVANGGWCDLLGTYYEILGSRSKKSALGQFFTPMPLCTMTAQMQGAAEGEGKKVNDPACGSARMLIAFDHMYKGNFMYGEDLDPMCCKMAALNLMMHGARGEIVNMNSLSRQDFRTAYRINPMLHISGIPWIEEIPAARAFQWSGNDFFKRPEEITKQKIDVQLGQLDLFGELI